MSRKSVRIIRTFGKVLFVLYIFFLVYFLFLAEWYGRTGMAEEYRYNLELFKEIRRFITYREQLGMLAAVRRGFFKTLFYSFGLSLCVEVVQLFTRVGSFDVDDILLNTIGGVLGYILFVICNVIRRRYHVRRQKKR